VVPPGLSFKHNLQSLSKAPREEFTPLLQCSEGGKTTFRLSCCVVATHLFLLAQNRQIIHDYPGFLRPAAHERVPRGNTIPAFHHSPDRYRIPTSYYVRSSRVRQVYLFFSVGTKDTSICWRCQLVFLRIVKGTYGEFVYIQQERFSTPL